MFDRCFLGCCCVLVIAIECWAMARLCRHIDNGTDVASRLTYSVTLVQAGVIFVLLAQAGFLFGLIPFEPVGAVVDFVWR